MRSTEPEGGEETRLVRDEDARPAGRERRAPGAPSSPTDRPPPGDEPMEIPWDALSAEAQRGVIVELVTSEGTEYGPTEVSLETKIEQVRRQIEQGEVLVLFDSERQAVNLVTRREHLRR